MKLIKYILLFSLSLGTSCLSTSTNLYPSNDEQVKSDDINFIKQLKEYLTVRIQLCIDQVPAGHGLLVHFQQSSFKTSSSKDVKTKNQSKYQKRFIKTAIKTFKEMPLEQRLGVMSTLAGTITLPSYMTSAAQAWDAEQISKIKSKAVEVELKKSKNGGGGGGNKTSPKPKLVKHAAKIVQLPPPLLPPVHGKRSFDQIYLVKRSMELNKLKKSQSITKGFASMSHGSPTIHGLQNGSHSTAHSTTRKAFSSSNISKPNANKTKQTNQTVSKVMSWMSASVNLLYIPVAWMTTHKAQRVTDDDTHSYKKRDVNEFMDERLPIVKCIPIAHLGERDFIIPLGALS